MAHLKNITLAAAACSLLWLGACHSDNGSPANNPAGINSTVAADSSRKVAVVISSIPFPSSMLDTLYGLDIKFRSDLLNPVTNIAFYTESNSQAANLGLFGADLAYVISFEQFQSVGDYMKATKYLADNIGVPLAFTAEVVERCQKNQTNKDSLSRIELESYKIIDRTLKKNQRDASEVLVLTGGWLEGVYLNTQSLDSVPQGTRRMRLYHVLMDQKGYVDKVLTLLNDISSSSTYCNSLVAPMNDVKTAFEAITSEATFNDNNLKNLADKVKTMRSLITKTGS